MSLVDGLAIGIGIFIAVVIAVVVTICCVKCRRETEGRVDQEDSTSDVDAIDESDIWI